MAHLKRLIHEIHRRSLWQVLGIYVAGSWLALQVVETLSETVGLPEWFGPVAFGLLIIGLPIVLATAFVQEGVRGEEASVPAGGAVSAETPAVSQREAADAPPSAEARSDAEPAAEPPRTEPLTPAPARPGGRHRLFTWRNALLGGAGAFALLGIVTGVYLAMRSLGIGPAGTLVAKGLIEEGDRVILAEFENLTPDSLLGEVVTEALRVDLAQTPVISLAEPSYVADVLGRMERPSDARLDAELAREVAVREGMKAVITGEIGTAGGAYVLSARVLTAEAGEELASLRETAEDSSRLVPAIDELSERLRERLGESLRTLRAGEPLERVTTGSLEALRKYSQALTAINRGEGEKGNALLEEALEIDSTFAMGWRKLATRVSGERQMEAVRRAYELRDRLTERERYHTIGIHHFYHRDFERSATAYRTLLDTHPDDGLALNNLAIDYLWMGELERAMDAWTRAIDAGYPGTDPYRNVVEASWELGRQEEARTALARFSEERAGHPAAARTEWEMALLEGDLPTARAAASRLLDHEVAAYNDFGRFMLAELDLTRGRIASWRRQLDSLRGPSGDPTDLREAMARARTLDLTVLGDTAAARRRVAAALERTSVDTLPVFARYNLLRLHARLGQAAAARSLFREIEAELDSTARYFPWIDGSRLARGEILTAEGRYEDAIEEFKAYSRERGPSCYGHCNVDELARVFDLAGQRDSAIAYYERYVVPNWYDRVGYMSEHPPVYRRLGELYDEAGDPESAARYYAAFLEMWEDADPELQPQVEAVRTRLEEILAERG